ncbi:amino acid adenylation domain-containing protein [Nocardia sp. SYP-A9097]|uniref:non-ribosomal peptide synthetase n=1 Tax=Nocardia sp. SYP-A9097 TaxID=2663237 RepID=UPI00129A64D2|nr:non-ribosomal peptide synthetase [Nocardia sp. SYP-A9097]MRH91600.1 amino acid adenylation domain-containing protein [Nocardia sp. SYP-A9097]
MKSLEDLQAAMAARLATAGLAAAPAVPVRRDRTRAALSFGQRYVWAHQQITPDSAAYNLCLALTFDGEVDADALRRSFLALVRRHEVLRTTYHNDEQGNPYQRIHDDLPPRLTDIDLTATGATDGRPAEIGHTAAGAADGPRAEIDCAAGNAAEADRRLAELTRAAAYETFDLSSESSLRVTFARTRPDRLVVLLVIQHIAWDGMTLPALSRDVENFYRQARTGDITVEPLRLQVADFAEWEQDRHLDGDHGAEIDFWASQFDGEVPELQLPCDRRPVTITERGDRFDRLLGERADANLRRLSTDLRSTPFAVFLAAYYLALRQTTGQRDIVIGTTVANREESGQEFLIGNLSNMIPLRCTGAGANTFAELVDQVRATTTEAFRHKHFPQEGIVRAANSATGHVGSKLFDTMVLFLHQKIDGPQLPGATTSWELIDNGGALLPLVVETFMHADRTDVQITYRTDLFDRGTIERLHEYIDQILAAATPGATLASLETLSASDRARLADWSHGDRPAITPETVDAMIRASAQEHPDRVAVIFDDIELDYTEFDSRVNGFTRLLLKRGVRNGDRIGVYAERSEWLPVIFAAVLRAGAVYVPADPSYPQDRIEYMLDDSELTLMVTTIAPDSPRHPGALLAGIHSGGSSALLDLTDPAILAELAAADATPVRADELARPIHPLDAAYLLYTSGTTGRPKGVVIHHRAIANHVQWMRDYLGFGEERILQKAPIGFDVSVFELVNALCTGSATVLPHPEWWQADVEALAEIIHRHRVTQLSLVPSVTRAFLDAGPDPERLQSMRYVYLGGESVPPALVEEASRVFGGTVLGLYGPTEAAMDLTHEDFAGTRGGDEIRSALIGVPESNSSVFVLDEQLRQVSPGVTGELYLGGVQLAQGYHRRPGLSSGTFVACPFAPESGARMYRTGDIVRWNSRGRLEYLGRVDDQVKIRGHRIELGEIGTTLRRMPGIGSAAAIAVPRGNDSVLVGYYVAEPNSLCATDSETAIAVTIRAYLAERLPEYMIPAALVRMASLPLTANGKLDRRALPEPDLGGSTGRGRDLSDGPETLVAEAVRQVLGLTDDLTLAADDDFLALGGDSITAIRMASALKKRGLAITTSALFDARTIAAIAAATTPITETSAPALFDAGADTGWIPLNPIAAMLVEKAGEYTGYSQATAVVTPPDATAERLTAAVRALLDRHPLLRARLDVAPTPDGEASPRHSGALSAGIHAEEVEPGQKRAGMTGDELAAGKDGGLAYYMPEVGAGYPPVELVEVEIAGEEWELTAGAVLQERLHAVGAGLDPFAGRMVGAVWVRTPDRAVGRLLLVIHHLVVDGVSWRILHDDLRAFWQDGVLEPETGTSVRAWNTNLARYAESDSLAGELPRWQQIAECADPLLGARAFDPAVDTIATLCEVTTELDAEDTRFLMTTGAQAFGCDFLDIQVAALAVAVHRFRRARDRDTGTVALTMERHGRIENLFAGADLANTVGWFTSTYPVALDVMRGIETDLVDAVKAVKEQLSAVPDSGIGWGLLRWLNEPGHDVLGDRPAPQLSFNYMGRFAVAESAEIWAAAPEFGYLGGHADAAMPVAAVLDVNTVTVTDGDRASLRASFRFPAGVLTEAEVHEFADLWAGGLRDFAKTVRDDSSRRFTPGDVLAREVTQLDLDRWQTLYGTFADVHPLAPMQAGLYFTALGSGGKDFYNVQTMIAVRGAVDMPRLTAALDTVINRYPNLRVAISVSHAGQPYAIVTDHVAVPVREVDFAARPDADQRLQDFLRADQGEQFDLSRGPLTRATVVHLPGAVHMLVLTSHHLLTDGWSGQLLPQEIFAAYLSDGTAAPLGNPDTFAEFLRLTQDREAATEAAWSGYLDGVQPCLVAPNRVPEGGGVPTGRSAVIDAEVVDRLTALAAELGTTFSVICQLAWANVLRYVTGSETAVFGEVVSGRPADLDEVDNAVGCFANTIPVAVGLRGAASWRELLAEIQRRRVELMEFHQYRLTSAIRATGVRRLFDSMFVFQSYPPGREELEALLAQANLDLVSFEGGGATDNALLVMIFPANSLLPGDGVQAVVFYAEDSFDDTEAEIIEAAFHDTLRAIAAAPDNRIDAAAVIGDEDHGLLVMRRMWQ